MNDGLSDTAIWIREAREGSSDALGRVLETCRNYLLLIANKELAQELKAKAGASDLIQETFVEAQRDFPRFQGSTDDELRAWLRQILLNNVSNVARSFRDTGKRNIALEMSLGADQGSSIAPFPIAAEDPTPSENMMSLELTEKVMSAIEELPADYRDVIMMRYKSDLGFDVIAERMGRSENAVRKLWFRALEKLEEKLSDET